LSKFAEDTSKFAEDAANTVSSAAQSVSTSVADSISETTNLPLNLTWAAKVYKEMLENPEISIPQFILKRAKGIVFLKEYKAGLLISLNSGGGVFLARLHDGTWSGPCAITVGGLSGGLQFGASQSQSVMLLNSADAVSHFVNDNVVRLGSNVGVAAGPVGRDLDFSVHLAENPAAAFSYSISSGLFAGVALTGAVVSVDHEQNTQFYGRAVTPADIVAGSARPPAPSAELAELHTVLNAVSSDEKLFRLEMASVGNMGTMEGALQNARYWLSLCLQGDLGEDLLVPPAVLQRAKGLVFMMELNMGAGFSLVTG